MRLKLSVKKSHPWRKLRVLIACECSGEIRRAFRALGHGAWSCDLKPAEDGGTHHIQGDAIKAIRHGCPTDGKKWDMVITHFTCRYLANSGSLRLYKGGKKINGMDLDRYAKMRDGALEFRRQFFLGEYRGPLCAENPVMHCWARELIDDGLEKVSLQTIQPYRFGDNASKATQLWLRDLPKLVINPADYFPPRLVCKMCGHHNDYEAAFKHGCVECGAEPAWLMPRWANQTDSGQNRLGPSERRAADRARTYPGIAAAMAAQWVPYLLNLT